MAVTRASFVSTTGGTPNSALTSFPTNGATSGILTSGDVNAVPHSIYFSIFDQGDQVLDSAAFLDNLRAGFVPDPAVNCKSGAKPVSFQLDSDGNPVGLDHSAIAERLFLSPHTARTHIRNVLRKLGARSRVDAVRIAIDSGLVETGDQDPRVPPAT